MSEEATTRQRYDEILDVAARLFRDRGYRGTSIKDIGASLGVTSAALYYHFRNKDEVLMSIMHQGLVKVTQAVEGALQGGEDPWERIRAALKEHLRVSLQYQDYAVVLLNELRHLSPEGQAQIIEERDAYEAMWTALFEEASAAGRIREQIDLHLLRLMLFGSVNLVVTWFSPEGVYEPDEICDHFLACICQGVEVNECEMR